MEKFYLPGLNANPKQKELSFKIKKNTSPMLYLFHDDTSAFYRTHFGELDNFKIREKRFLDFETPNRALITHEYDMRIDGELDWDEFHYLFNPIERLSWLKISQEGKRLSVAGNEWAKNKVKEKLVEELKLYSDESWDELWDKKKGLPCFIKLEKGCYNDFLLTASYYDSLKKDDSQKTELFSPLLERKIKYEYFPLKNKSSWLYIKSPSNFNVKCNSNEIHFDKKNNEVDFAHSKEADQDKISLTIKNKKHTEFTHDNTVKFSFNIIVPPSLKIWFLTIYYLSFATLIALLWNVLNIIFVAIFGSIWHRNPIGELIESSDFGGLLFTIVAVIITTRGWLISEETIFKRYSIHLTFFMVLMIALYCIFIIWLR